MMPHSVSQEEVVARPVLRFVGGDASRRPRTRERRMMRCCGLARDPDVLMRRALAERADGPGAGRGRVGRPGSLPRCRSRRCWRTGNCLMATQRVSARPLRMVEAGGCRRPAPSRSRQCWTPRRRMGSLLGDGAQRRLLAGRPGIDNRHAAGLAEVDLRGAAGSGPQPGPASARRSAPGIRRQRLSPGRAGAPRGAATCRGGPPRERL